MKDQYAYKSCIPSFTSRTQKNDGARAIRGLGNNVSNQGNKHSRNFNAQEEKANTAAEQGGQKRREVYASIRSTDAYKMARAEAKRKRQRTKQYSGVCRTAI